MFHHRHTLTVFNGFSELLLEETQILAEISVCKISPRGSLSALTHICVRVNGAS